jgi:transcriptional regulator with XRE-family HTH domain
MYAQHTSPDARQHPAWQPSGSPSEVDPDRRGLKPANLFTYMVAGTLSIMSAQVLESTTATGSQWINPQQVQPDAASTGQATSSAAEQLSHIREATGISVVELARIFGVTRQAVHDWQNGKALSSANLDKLEMLAGAVNTLLEAGVSIAPHDLRRSVHGGKSLLDAIKAMDNVEGLATELAIILKRNAEQRQRLNEHLKGRAKPEFHIADYAAPHLREE